MTDDFTRLLKEGAELLMESRRFDLLLPLLPCLLGLVLSGCGNPQGEAAAKPRPVRSVTARAQLDSAASDWQTTKEEQYSVDESARRDQSVRAGECVVRRTGNKYGMENEAGDAQPIMDDTLV